jgi:hypothetical protein
MGAVLLISISTSLQVSAVDTKKASSEAQKKSATTFLTSFATSAGLNAALYGGALALLKSEHPYVGATFLAAATASPWVVTKLAEQIKGDELTTKEAIQLSVGDFFTNLAAGGFMASSCEQGWVNKAFIAVCVAKLAHILWWVGELPVTPDEVVDLNEQLPSQVAPAVIHEPQEIKVVVPAVPTSTAKVVVPTQPKVAVSPSQNYPWMGGEKPNHQDAFMLLGN